MSFSEFEPYGAVRYLPFRGHEMGLEGLDVVFPRRVVAATLLRMLLALLVPFVSFTNEPNWLIFCGLIVEAMLMMHAGIQSLMQSFYRNKPIREWIRDNMEQLTLVEKEQTGSTVVSTRHILASKLVNVYVGNRRAKLIGYSYVILAHCLLYEGVCVMNGRKISHNSMINLDNLYHFGNLLSLLLLTSELWNHVTTQLNRSSYIKIAVEIVLLTINRVYNSPNNSNAGNNQTGSVSSKYVVNTHDCMIKSLLKRTEDISIILTEISHLTDIDMRSSSSGIIDNSCKFGSYDELNEIENDINSVEVAIIEGCQQGTGNGEDTTSLSYEDRIVSKASDAYKVARGNLRYLFFLWCLLIIALVVRAIPLYSYVVIVSKTSLLPIIPTDNAFLVVSRVEQVMYTVLLISIISANNGGLVKKIKTN